MKKMLILLSILIVGTMVSSSTQALYIDNDEATWYTVPELLAYKNEIEREVSLACGGDEGCRQEIIFDKMENEPKYMALEQLVEQQFVVTAVNPGGKYIKVLFFGEDMMLARMGISEKLEINQVYIGWLENNVERIYRDGMDPVKYTEGKIDGAHKIYAWQDGTKAENAIRNDLETRLEAIDLVENTTGQIIYNVDSGPGKFAAYGRFDYLNCLSEPDYISGAECRLMISAEKGQAYLPPRETILASNTTASRESDDENTNNDEKLDTSLKNTPDNEEKLDTYPKNEQETETIAEFATVTAIKTPDTGTNTSPCNQKTVEFPWWLVIMIAVADAAVMWLFWPNRKKSPKK